MTKRRKTIKKWIIIFRLHTLGASWVPVSLGTAYAWHHHKVFDLKLFLAMLIASILIQMSANQFNDFFDFKKGIDNPDSVGKTTALVTGDVSPYLILGLAISFVGTAGLLGLYIIWRTSLIIAIIGAISIAVAFLYSAGPYPISATPFGEFFSGFFMGTIIVGISYYIQTGFYSPDAFWISLPYTILIGAILTGNNLRDIDEDREGGRRTLVILLGKEKGIDFLKYYCLLAFTLVPIFIFLDWLPLLSLLVFIALPSVFKSVKIFRNNDTPQTMGPAMGLIAKTHMIYGVLMILGLLI